MYLLNTRLEPDFALGVVEALQQVGFPRVERTVGAEIFEAMRTRSFDTRLLFEDALTTLAALKQHGFLLGVVTNRQYGGPLFIEDMRNFGLLDYFEEPSIAISADLNVRKPHPAIFQYALDALHVQPEETVMVGDSLGADIVGAKELSMLAVWKPSPIVVARARTASEKVSTTQTFERILLDMARQYEQFRGRPIPEELMPDLIIERLNELLDVFVEVGKQ
jgi:FMN phosphatase YigB (HAD superfamily)